MEINYFLFYKTHIGGVTNRNISTYSSKEELNEDLSSMEGVVELKVIAGYLLEERS
jgi:hypothetical protein